MDLEQFMHDFADRFVALAMRIDELEGRRGRDFAELEARIKALEVARDTPTATPQEDTR